MKKIIVLLTILISCDHNNTGNRVFYEKTEYHPFVLKGYEPGSIISVKEDEINNQAPRSWIEHNLINKSILDDTITILNKSFSFDVTSEFIAGIKASANFKSISPELSAELTKLKNISFSAYKIKSLSLNNGAMTLYDVLDDLPCPKLNQLREVINSGKALIFINDVLVADSGSEVYVFKKDFNDSLKGTLRTAAISLFDFGQNIKWKSNDSLNIQFDKTIVGYKGDTIKLDMINEAIKKRQCENGVIKYPEITAEKFNAKTKFEYFPEKTFACYGECDSRKDIKGDASIYSDIGGTGNSHIKIQSSQNNISGNSLNQNTTIDESINLIGGSGSTGQDYIAEIREYKAHITLPNNFANWSFNLNILPYGGEEQNVVITLLGASGFSKQKTISRKENPINFYENISAGEYDLTVNIGHFHWGKLGRQDNNGITIQTEMNLKLNGN